MFVLRGSLTCRGGPESVTSAGIDVGYSRMCPEVRAPMRLVLLTTKAVGRRTEPVHGLSDFDRNVRGVHPGSGGHLVFEVSPWCSGRSA
jgi:hypothetical protein